MPPPSPSANAAVPASHRRAPRLATTGVVVTQGGGKTAAIVAMLAGLAREGEAPPVLGEAPPAGTSDAAEHGYAALAERLLAPPPPAGSAPAAP